jgi:site-specific DNA-methyltransferase (adenine-specific)
MWLRGGGFPKSLDISKAIDKLKGAEREIICKHPHPAGSKGNTFPLNQECYITAPATQEAKKWEGYGTALRPAYEPIILAIKPNDGSYANNALKWGVAGLNIDKGRIFEGRFPANVILDEESAELLDKQKDNISRFFYCAKASKNERTANGLIENNHPTLKPLELIKYLVKLATPPDGLVLDPFVGSGTTCVACKVLGYDCIGIEKELNYIEIANKRLKGIKANDVLF